MSGQCFHSHPKGMQIDSYPNAAHYQISLELRDATVAHEPEGQFLYIKMAEMFS